MPELITALRQAALFGVVFAEGDATAPLWPTTVTGSISHCAGACIAAMAHARDYAGLDLESVQPLTADLWPLVLTTPALARLPQDQPGLMALRVFCAKEAAYKAQYAVTGQLFDFQTLDVEVQGQNFVARFQHAVGQFGVGACLGGVLRQAAGIQAALVWIA
jgi:4'-phosphopantetheinyl transferase EntD